MDSASRLRLLSRFLITAVPPGRVELRFLLRAWHPGLETAYINELDEAALSSRRIKRLSLAVSTSSRSLDFAQVANYPLVRSFEVSLFKTPQSLLPQYVIAANVKPDQLPIALPFSLTGHWRHRRKGIARTRRLAILSSAPYNSSNRVRRERWRVCLTSGLNKRVDLVDVR